MGMAARGQIIGDEMHTSMNTLLSNTMSVYLQNVRSKSQQIWAIHHHIRRYCYSQCVVACQQKMLDPVIT